MMKEKKMKEMSVLTSERSDLFLIFARLYFFISFIGAGQREKGIAQTLRSFPFFFLFPGSHL